MSVLTQIAEQFAQPQGQVERLIRDVVMTESHPVVREVTIYSIQGGKRIRAMLTLLAARLFTSSLDQVVPVAAAAELIHAATLLHDDVIDNGDLRRHQVTVNKRWGNRIAVLAGDSLLTKAIRLLADESVPEIMEIMVRMLQRMCEGEIMQSVSVRLGNQSETRYLEQIERKTAQFFSACCQAGALVAGANASQVKAMSLFGLNIGMAYQIIDDLLDIVGDRQTLGKPVGVDLRTGVATLPWLYFLQHSEINADSFLCVDSLGERDKWDTLVEMLDEQGALDYTMQMARLYADKAKAILLTFPSTDITRLLAATVDELVQSCYH